MIFEIYLGIVILIESYWVERRKSIVEVGKLLGVGLCLLGEEEGIEEKVVKIVVIGLGYLVYFVGKVGKWNTGLFELGCILGMCLMLESKKEIMFIIGMEILGLCSYIMCGKLDKGRELVGLKYFIIGSLGTGMVIMGISCLYGYGGVSVNERVLGEVLGFSFSFKMVGVEGELGKLLILLGVWVKLGGWLSFMWLILVYDGVYRELGRFLGVLVKVVWMFSLMGLLGNYEVV